jgi:3-oxoacyl-[acyl-carrier-protein] synthase III
MKFNNITIKGTGSYLPSKRISNEELVKNIDTTADWIKDKLGISERRHMDILENPSDMAYNATIKALANANLDKEDLDMIIVVTSSSEQLSPSTACILNNKLELKKNVPSFDVNAVCAGFVYGITLAASLISSGAYKNILIVATEGYSKITDFNHRNSVFFGDGAGAIILSSSDKGWISSELSANGKGTGLTGFSLKHGEKYTTVPKQVWDQAVDVLPKSIESILRTNEMSVNDIDLFIPHQASINMLNLIAEKVNLSKDKLKTVMNKYGNIAGASIPIVLDELNQSGELTEGSTILLSAIGSGWAWGSVLIKSEK